jgi:hypothetical protein
VLNETESRKLELRATAAAAVSGARIPSLAAVVGTEEAALRRALRSEGESAHGMRRLFAMPQP